MGESHWRRSLFYSASAGQPAGETHWRPRADVYRSIDGWLLKFELAGVELDDIEVCTAGSVVSVRGTRHDLTGEQRDCCQYHMEIAYNRFERSVELPCAVEDAQLELNLSNGILLVRVVTSGARADAGGKPGAVTVTRPAEAAGE